MRKQQQQQILELLDTLREAQSAGLYADAQEGALAVGAFIESVAGEGTHTVKLLEEYCELLYGASMGKVGGKALRKHLIKLENSVRDELAPDRIEVVFVSYNASMSDSILSIYAAAKADPACDAVWLPVPYFEKNRDGSFGTMHYEGAECYGDTDCADWREYDIEARRPDAIFTFNPYDASNLVTSVHPDFYCERLRGLTDLLVYVPYFVTADADGFPEHFCTVAGCVYAHKVIVQSEEIRDTYIRVFKKTYGSKLGKPEDKFVALGSPKFDAVLRAKRENCELPDAWRKLIGGRKVIFYNTSVGTILTGGAQYLKKLRHVLDVFRERDDAILWWRPHPLSEATYDSMRPELADEYRRIVAGYKRVGFGIYDDTADLHRAIAWTDAYYGDASSVVRLYKETGKPAMKQNPVVSEYGGIIASCGCEYDGWFYFNPYGSTALFRMNLDTHKSECLIKGELVNNYYFINMSVNDGVIFCTPMLSDSILIYDIKNENAVFLPLDTQVVSTNPNYDNSMKFLISFYINGKIYLVPFTYPAFVSYCPETKSLEYHTDWFDKDFSKCTQIFYAACVIGNKIAAVGERPGILIFDTEAKSLEIVDTDYSGGFSAVSYLKSNLWLSSYRDGTIIKFNPNTKEMTEFKDLPPDISVGKAMFMLSEIIDMEVWFFANNTNMNIKIDTETGEIRTIRIFKPQPGSYFYHCFIEKRDNKIITSSWNDDGIVVYDVGSGDYNQYLINFESAIDDYFTFPNSGESITDDKNRPFNGDYKYGLQYNLNHFISLTPDSTAANRTMDNEKTAGQRIYEHVKHKVMI
jgi:hypothetical protein